DTAMIAIMRDADVLSGRSDADAGDDGDATTRRRLCAFSGCRAPLPPASGPGNRARYCQDGKTWGPKNVTCKQAGNAEELLASIRGHTATTAPVLSELGTQIDAVLGPARRLTEALELVRTQLQDEMTKAHRERDEALALAAEERGRREAAEAEALDAERRAQA